MPDWLADHILTRGDKKGCRNHAYITPRAEGGRGHRYGKKRCDLSLFQLGLRTLEHFLHEELPMPVQFHGMSLLQNRPRA